MLLEVQHIRKAFPNGTRALSDVSFSVDAGEFVSVIGPSGAGKTTLFRILNGALLCDAGEILVSGVHFEAAGRRQRRAIQATIGTIYQDYALVENATCRQNVLNACRRTWPFSRQSAACSERPASPRQTRCWSG